MKDEIKIKSKYNNTKSVLPEGLYFSFVGNDRFFKKRAVLRLVRTINKQTQYFKFAFVKIICAKSGLRCVRLKLYVKRGIIGHCFTGKSSIYIWEKCNGEMKIGISGDYENNFEIKTYLIPDLLIATEFLNKTDDNTQITPIHSKILAI
jgi:hypothetical protein